MKFDIRGGSNSGGKRKVRVKVTFWGAKRTDRCVSSPGKGKKDIDARLRERGKNDSSDGKNNFNRLEKAAQGAQNGFLEPINKDEGSPP